MVLGKVRALGVYFDTLNENNLPVFSGGDLVSGRVVVDVAGDVRVKSLDIVARGVAKVRWTESRNGGAHTAYTQNYTEEVEYLHHYDTLIGEERGEWERERRDSAPACLPACLRALSQCVLAPAAAAQLPRTWSRTTDLYHVERSLYLLRVFNLFAPPCSALGEEGGGGETRADHQQQWC